MRHALKLLTGLTVGATVIYFFDQEHGARRRASLTEVQWPTPARLLAVAIGSAMAWHGTSRRIIPGIPLTLMGFGLLARAVTSGRPASASVPDTDDQPWVQGPTVKRTVTISAPIDRVFAFWAHYDETFPHSIPPVKQITAMGHGRSRWVLDSPGAADLIWNTMVTRFEPNKELAWRTEAGSAAQHMGRVRFIDSSQGTTTIHIQLTYNSLAEALVRSMASSAGHDTKTLLEDGLNRIKATIESGTVPRQSFHRPADAAEAAR
ncbi:SRPBCC family protein [Nitrospira sp. Nam74]